MGRQRDLRYDFIRVIAMGAVIFIHVLDSINISNNLGNQIIKEIVQSVLLLCNPLFFMISGHFNLHFKGTVRTDYYKYYVKKATNVVIPLVLYQMLYYCVTIYLAHGQISFSTLSWNLIINIFQGYTTNYFWFMYPLIAYLIAAPFLSKMLDNLTENEQNLFMVILILFQACGWALKLLNINWGLWSFPFTGWLIYFLLGRLLEINRKDISDLKSSLMIIMGITLNVVLTIVFPQSKGWGLHDLAPTFILLAVVVYQEILKILAHKNLNRSNLIKFLAQYSYGIYLCHGMVLLIIVPRLNINNVLGRIITVFIVGYLLSIIIAVGVDNLVLKHLKKRISKI